MGEQFRLFPEPDVTPPSAGTPSKGTEAMREIATTGRLSTRTPMASVPSVLEHGFLTQHELGKSKGAYAPGARRAQEEHLFPERSGNPVYGYVAKPGRPDTAKHYGEATFNFADPVRERTTVTLMDSLGGSAESLGLRPLKGAATASTDLEYPAPYLEAQIHEPHPQADEVSSIRLDVNDIADQLSYRQAALDRGDEAGAADYEGIMKHSKERLGMAMNAASLRKIPVTVTKDETYTQQRMEVGGEESATADFLDRGSMQAVPQTDQWITENLGGQFQRHPVSGRMRFSRTGVENFGEKLRPPDPRKKVPSSHYDPMASPDPIRG